MKVRPVLQRLRRIFGRSGMQKSSAARACPSGPALLSSHYSKLPQDILDLIISFVEDQETLVACRLSSRRLLNTSTRMALQHLWIRRADYPAILRKIQAMPEIASAVKRLSFNGRDDDEEIANRFNELAVLASHLPQLRHITLKAHDFDLLVPLYGETVPYRDTILSSSVTGLALFRVTFSTPSQLLSLIQALPNLDCLYLVHVGWGSTLPQPLNGNSASTLMRIPRLSGLTVKNTPAGLAPYIVNQESVQGLQTFQTEVRTCDRWGWWRIWNSNVVYPNLQILIVCRHGPQLPDIPPRFPTAPNMCYLALYGLHSGDWITHVPGGVGYVASLLSCVASPGVETLMLSFFVHRLTDLERFCGPAHEDGGRAAVEWLPVLSSDIFSQTKAVIYQIVINPHVASNAILDGMKLTITQRIRSLHECWDRRDVVVVEVVVAKER